MISARWFKKRQPHWSRLEALVERSGRRGVTALSVAELRALTLLYRQTASDLAAVREDPTRKAVAVYLNQLLGRAHNLVYMGRRRRPHGVLHFYRYTYPRVFRETLPYTVAAFAIFIALAAAGYLICLGDASFQRYFLGAHMTDTIERGQMWTHPILTLKPLASSAIMTNNLVVSFALFALGITAGVGTVYLLALNGLLLGVISAACQQSGMSLRLWSFVAPHGVLELPAIFIAGGAGLLLARGLLFPGFLPRVDSLRLAGDQAVKLLLGAVPLLVVAGVTEGFVSPLEITASIKLLLAGLLGALLVFYLWQAGRFREEPVP